MHVRGRNNVGRTVQTDPTLLRYASTTTEQKKCWELLTQKFDRFQTLHNNSQQHATTRTNTQQGVQTDATCNIQQCWGVDGQQCCVGSHGALQLTRTEWFLARSVVESHSLWENRLLRKWGRNFLNNSAVKILASSSWFHLSSEHSRHFVAWQEYRKRKVVHLLIVHHRNDVKMFKTSSSEAIRLRLVVPLAFRWTSFLWSVKNKKRKLSRTGAWKEECWAVLLLSRECLIVDLQK